MQRLRLKDVEDDLLLNAQREDSRRVAWPAPDGVLSIILWDNSPKSIDIDKLQKQRFD